MNEFNPKDIAVIIPTRDEVNPLVLKAIPGEVKVHIAKDTEFIKGQTKLREYYARKANSKYIFLLDDDIIIPKNTIQRMLSMMNIINASAICGNKKAIAYNDFSKGVLKFKEYTSFIKTGFTIWNRSHFLKVMNKVPKDCPANVGDIVIGDILNQLDYDYLKINSIIAEHHVKVTRKGFYEYRYKAGVALAWYYRKWKRKGYWLMLSKMFFGMFISNNQGVFIYRYASCLGLIRGYFK